MIEAQEERLIAAFERMAAALAGIDETGKRQFERRWPEPKERRDAVVTRVPNEEDLIREAHGSSDQPLAEWLNPPEGEEIIGTREREWRRTHPEKYPGNHPNEQRPLVGDPDGNAGAQTTAKGDQADGGGVETAEGKA